MPSTAWHEDGLRFECQRCKGCCGGFPGYVWMTGQEVDAAAEHLGMTPEGFVEEYARRIGGRYTLAEVGNWNCVMLTDSGCRIYPARPVQCRTFPFWEENLREKEYWDRAAESCPGMNRGRLYTLDEIERLQREHKR